LSSGFLEEEEEEFRKVYIPGTSGDYIEAPMDVSDEDALIWARDNVLEAEETLAPRTFAAPIEGQMLTPRAEEEDSGPIDAFLGSASRAFQGIVPGVSAALAVAGGDEEAYDLSQQEITRASERQREIAPDLVQQNISGWNQGDIVKAYEEDGLIGASAKTAEFALEQTSTVGGTMLPDLLGAIGGKVVAGNVGALAGGVGVGFLNFLSHNLERAYEEGRVNTEDINLPLTLGVSGAQSLLNAIPVIRYSPWGKTVSKGLQETLFKSSSQLVSKIDGAASAASKVADKSPIRSFVGGLLTEEATELGQTALERWQAGLPVSPAEAEAGEEYLDIMFTTIFPAGAIGGVGAIGDTRARSRGRARDQKLSELHNERVAVWRGVDKFIEEEKSAAIESEIQKNLAAERKKIEDSIIPDATVEDIHNVANERNILWDEDPGFMAFTKRVTGYYELDQIKDKPKLINELRTQLSAAPIQDSSASMQLITDREAIQVARYLPKKSKSISREDISQALSKAAKARGDRRTLDFINNLESGLSKDLADSIIDATTTKLNALGFIELVAKATKEGTDPVAGSPEPSETEKIYKIAPPMEGVSPGTYRNIIKDSLDSGFFPTNLQLSEKYGIDTPSKYDQILRRALEVGDVEKVGDRYIPYAPDYTDQVQGYRISVNDEIQPTWYETKQEAAAAKRDMMGADRKVRGQNVNIISDMVQSDALMARRSGKPLPSSWGMPSNKLKTVPTDEIVIVDNPKVSPDSNLVSREFQYEVEKVPNRWVVNDAEGNIVKGFRSKNEASKFVKNKKANSFSWDLVVNGEVIESHSTRADARKAIPVYKRKIKKSLFDFHKSELLRGDISDKLATKEAKALSESESRSYFRKYVPSIGKREVDPGLFEAGKGTIYSVRERRVGGEGKITKFRDAGLFNTEEDAIIKKGELERGRVGRESVGGKLVEPVSPEVRPDPSVVETVEGAQPSPVIEIPALTEEQSAFRKAVSNKIKN
jgi:hypothetical protein